MERPFTIWYHSCPRGPEPLSYWYPDAERHRHCPDLIEKYFSFDLREAEASGFMSWMKRRPIECWLVAERIHPSQHEYVFAPTDVVGFKAEVERDWPDALCNILYSL